MLIKLKHIIIYSFTIVLVCAIGCIHYPPNPYNKGYHKLENNEIDSYDKVAVLIGDKPIYVKEVDGKKGNNTIGYNDRTRTGLMIMESFVPLISGVYNSGGEYNKGNTGSFFIELPPGPHNIVVIYMVAKGKTSLMRFQLQSINFEAKVGYTYGFDYKEIDDQHVSIKVVPKAPPMRGGGKVRPVFPRPRTD